MLFRTTKKYNNRYWFEEVCFESDTNGFCSNDFLVVKHFNVVHDSKSLRTSVLVWRGLLLIRNQQYLQQPFDYSEASQCYPWQPKPRIIGTDLTGSASNLKPTVSATTLILWWNVSMLSISPKTNHRYWFEEVCFESETNGFHSNHLRMVKRFNCVHDNQSIWSSVLIWRSLLRIWNQRFLQQRFSCGETFQAWQWQPKPGIICNDLMRSATNLKPLVSAATIFLL